MKKCLNFILLAMLLTSLPVTAFAWHWADLWQTRDQQAATLLKKGKAHEAAQVFQNQHWRAVSLYKAGDYDQAYKQFSSNKSSDDQYNAGNSAAYQGKYDAALKSYDQALAINPDNADAATNREIIKKLKEKKEQQDKSSDKNNKDDKKDKNKDNSKDNKQDANQNNKNNNQQDKGDNKNNSKDNSNSDKKGNKDKAQKDKKGDSANSKDQNQPDSKQQNPANAAPQADNPQNTMGNSTAGSQPASANPQNEASTGEGLQTTNEDNKQMLRRLADDPGGLLRQKFLRDYMRRHPGDSNQDQGDNNPGDNNNASQ